MSEEEAPREGGESLSGTKRESEVNRQKKMAVLRFNTKPQLGLEYLRGLGLWDGSEKELATWISTEVGLSKRRIGEFFGGTHPLSQRTFDKWLDAIDMDVPLDVALRTLLRGFRLPGEAQCIDRIMARFAVAYGSKAPEWPFSEDTAYVLAFSLVMLNTDLHSSSVRGKRMTSDDFVANNRGIGDDGDDLPEDLLRELYEGVRKNEIKMDDGDLYESELITFMGARKAGWLEKKYLPQKNEFCVPDTLILRRRRRWHRLWFVLCDGCLYYFSSPADVDKGKPPRATIPLDQGLEVTRPHGAAPGREFAILRRRKKQGLPLVVDGDSTNRRPSSLTRSASSSKRLGRDQPEVIKSVKKIGAGPTKVGTATEIRLRARDVADAQAWADALRAEEEALPVGEAAAAAAKRAAAMVRARRSSKNGERPVSIVDRPAVSVAQPNSHTPLHSGWLRKRGEINTAWKDRYFALFSGVTCTTVDGERPPADEPVLMYFKDQSKFAALIDGGEDRPYKGAVRLGAVTEMRRKKADDGKPPAIALVTQDRIWLLSSTQGDPDPNLDSWWYALEGACHTSRRYLAA